MRAGDALLFGPPAQASPTASGQETVLIDGQTVYMGPAKAISHLFGQKGDFTETAALQICSQRGIKQALPAAEDMARQAVPLPLRLSAIAALGAFGRAEQANLLRTLEKTDGPLRAAAHRVIERIRTRSHG